MGTGGAAVAVLAGKYAELRPHLDERGWRLYLGSEARAYAAGEGCGLAAAVAVVAEAAGVSRATVMAGAGELAEGAEPMPGRARRPGAGRRKVEEGDLGLRAALRDLLAASTRGDPMVAVTWTTLSLREIVRQMAARGHRCEKDALARMMREDGYSLQGNSRVIEGRQHPDRDAQFRHINAMIAAFRAAGDPVVSVDAKKKEQLGPYWRPGRSWRRKGDPVRVRDHDFPDAALGKITPYGVYDIAANTGFVSVGTSCDTAAFAVSALRLWWREQGAARYPAGRRLLVTCDAGGSNGYRCRLWKDQLARLAAETGLEITVCHFPPGTSLAPAVGSGAGAVASPVVRSGSHFSPAFACGPLHCRDHGQGCPVSSPRRLEPCMRFSRTRLTDAVHRQHSASPASPGRAWVRRRSRQGRSVPDGSVTRTTPPIVRTHASVCVSWRQTAPSASA